jgi:virulence factor Mce-like protein
MRARFASVTAAVVVAVALVSGVLITSSPADSFTITADVTQAPNLFEGGRVMVRGVEVGTIADVVPTPSGVRLTLEIVEDTKVAADARLLVVPITLIADRYVQLVPPYSGGPTLADGDHISIERTTIPAELDDVLEQLKGLLEALEPAREDQRGPLARLVRALDAATVGRSKELGGVLDSSSEVLGNLAASQNNITGLISNLDQLFFALANRTSEIGIVNERFALVAQALARDQEDLEGTIENLALLADETAGLLSESGDDLGRSFGRLGRVLRAVLRRQDELSEGMRWTNVISQALGATDASGRGLYAYSGRQAAPGTEGAAYNYRIDSRDTIGCERIEAVSDSVRAILENATVDDVMDTLLSFIPDEYDEDLAFLLRQLVRLCTEVPEAPVLDARAAAELRRIADRIGTERFLALVGRWFVEGYAGVAP